MGIEQFLLSTFALFDIAKQDNNATHQWFSLKSKRSRTRIYLNYFSVSCLLNRYEDLRRRGVVQADDKVINDNVHKLCRSFKAKQNFQLVGCNPKVIEKWTELFVLPNLSGKIKNSENADVDIGFEEQLVISSAIIGNSDNPLKLVTRDCSFFGKFNIRIEDPYSSPVHP